MTSLLNGVPHPYASTGNLLEFWNLRPHLRPTGFYLLLKIPQLILVHMKFWIAEPYVPTSMVMNVGFFHGVNVYLSSHATHSVCQNQTSKVIALGDGAYSRKKNIWSTKCHLTNAKLCKSLKFSCKTFWQSKFQLSIKNQLNGDYF